MTLDRSNSIIFDKRFIFVTVINLFIMTAYNLLLTTGSPYAMEVLHVHTSTSGLVAGAIVLGCLGGRFLSGYVIDNFGFKNILFVGFVIFLVTMVALILLPYLWFQLIIRFIGGLGVGLAAAVTSTLVARIIPQDQRGIGISVFSMTTILAAALGPFMGISLMKEVGYNNLFILCIVMGAIGFVLSLVLPLSYDFGRRCLTCPSSQIRLSDFMDYAALPISMAFMVISIGYASIQTFLSFYSVEINLVKPASAFFIVYAVAVLLSRPISGKLYDRKGPNFVIYPALLAFALGLFCISRAESAVLLTLAAILVGVGYGNIQSIAQTIAVDIVPKNRVVQATTTYFICFDIGIGIGPYALGLLISGIGYREMYLSMVAVVLLSIPVYYFAHGYRKRTHPCEEPVGMCPKSH